MKSAIQTGYGSPDVVQLVDVEKPVPKENEVLIRVRAASLNPLDWRMMRGKPSIVRAMGGLTRPKNPRMGYDVAGVAEAIGSGVTQIKAGEDVFGFGRGAFAEYACSVEEELVSKPPNLTFEQAASVSVAGRTALQGLRDKGRLQPGQRVLINGAAGGVGTFAVQLAKWMGSKVTAVCSARNLDLVRSLGADHVLDYAREDFTRSGHRYDVVFDCVANRSLGDCRRALAPKGVYIAVTGKDVPVLGPIARFIAVVMVSSFVSQTLTPMMARPSRADMIILRDLLESGRITPVIDKCYDFYEVQSAISYLEQGHARGKVVLTIANH